MAIRVNEESFDIFWVVFLNCSNNMSGTNCITATKKKVFFWLPRSLKKCFFKFIVFVSNYTKAMFTPNEAKTTEGVCILLETGLCIPFYYDFKISKC